MASETLLAHLTGRFVTQAENLATESLAYLLDRHEVASAAFHRFILSVHPDLPHPLRYWTQNWAAEDQAIPDLVGVASDGTQPLVLEAKFWAGLTENQPVTYLGRLPAQEPGLLVFVAPAARERYLWHALLDRCRGTAVEVTPRNSQLGVQSGDVSGGQGHVMAVTSWSTLLAALDSALEMAHEHEGLSDLRQLQGLCQKMDEEAFLPIRSEELTGDIGRRLEQLSTVIDDVVEELKGAGHADTAGLSRSAGSGWFGRYLKLAGWECLLHVNFHRWATERPTPVWLRVTDKRVSLGHELVEALNPLRHAVPSRLVVTDGRILIPLLLSVGADRDQVQRELIEQAQELASLMGRASPDRT